MGTLHGGVLCDIADAAMGIAYSSNLAEGEDVAHLPAFLSSQRVLYKDFKPFVEKISNQGSRPSKWRQRTSALTFIYLVARLEGRERARQII